MADATSSVYLQTCLDRLRAGDAVALDRIIERAADRLRHLTGKMLGSDFARLRRWEDADDVFQNAAVRLCRALRETVPDSPLGFYRLAAVQVRRELIDLARHHFGPHGPAARHESDAVRPNAATPARPFDPATDTQNPGKLAEWTDFHRAVESLPEHERDVFELLWYQDLSQAEAADLLGVDVRTVQRRWRQARLSLHDFWKGNRA